MKFQIPFSRNFKYLDKDKIQIFINYKPDIIKLDNFINQYKDYRIIIAFGEEEDKKGGLILNDYKIIQALLQKYPDVDLVVRMPTYDHVVEEDLNRYNIPHYYQYICCDWENLLGFCSLNITDIRIGGNLPFMLYFTSKITKEKNIRLRCFCNYCEQKWQTIPSIKNFFIRPEDIPFYSNYIDTFEFRSYGDNTNYNVLYEVFGIEHKWFGKLSEIILNYQGNEDNRTLIPEFGEYRSRCQRKCLIDSNSCKICDRIADLSYSLEDKNIIIRSNLKN